MGFGTSLSLAAVSNPGIVSVASLLAGGWMVPLGKAFRVVLGLGAAAAGSSLCGTSAGGRWRFCGVLRFGPVAVRWAGVVSSWPVVCVGGVLRARGFFGTACVSGVEPTVADAALERAMTLPLIVLEVT